MLEENSQYETENNEHEDELEVEQDNSYFEKEVVAGRALMGSMNFLGIITFVITIITAIIRFVKFKWFGGLSTLFVGIALTLVLISIGKIIELLTINTIRMTRIEEQLEELAEDGIVNLVIDPNVKIPNRETRRNKK